MTEADVWRIVNWANDYDSIVFIWQGEQGTQPVLMPNKVYQWRPDDDIAEKSVLRRLASLLREE